MQNIRQTRFRVLTECRNQLIAASVATIGSFGTGTVFGWSAVAINSLRMDFNKADDSIEISLVTSLAILGAFIGGPLAGFSMDYVGRKISIIIFSVPFLLGWLIMCSAYLLKPGGFFLLYIGRLLTGACAGCYLVIIPTYVKEASSDSMRGMLGASVPLLLVTGILYTFIIGAFRPWLYTTGCCCIPPICLGLGALLIPETPGHLIRKRKLSKAMRSVKWLNRIKTEDAAQAKMLEIFASENIDIDNTKEKIKKGKLLSRPVLLPMLIIVIVVFFQQFGGVNAVTLYTRSIFESAGNFVDPDIAIILVGIVQVLFVLAAMFLVDIVGRRTLLVGGSFVMGLSLGILGVYFYLQEKGDGSEEKIAWVPIVTICVYMAAYSCGVGSIPWVLATEIYNPDYRAESATVMTSSYWIFGFIVAQIYENLRSALKDSGSFWLYGGFCIGGSIFAALFVPETKGKSSEDILKLFAGKKSEPSSNIVTDNNDDNDKTAPAGLDSSLVIESQSEMDSKTEVSGSEIAVSKSKFNVSNVAESPFEIGK